MLRPADLHDDTAEALLLGPIGGADPLQLRRLRHELRRLAVVGGEPAGDVVAAAVGDLPGAGVLAAHVRGPVLRVARVLAAGRTAVEAGGSAESVLWAVWEASQLAGRWEAASRAGGSTGAAADRDLDAVVDLFDAAARFTDRLPAASPRDFYEHLVAQQVPGDTSSPVTGGPEAVRVLTAHSSKGLEWDLVCIAGVQEGSWPDLRRRGSLLGSDLLVEVLAGRDGAGVSTLARQLAEERRLFYVAATRARRRLLVTAVSGEEEQPSRFLDELDPRDDRRPLAEPGRGMHLPGLVAELRAAVCDRGLEADRAGRRCGRVGPVGGSRHPGGTSGGLVGACPAVRRRAGSGPGGPGSRQPVAYRVLPAVRVAGAARTARRPRGRRDPGIPRHVDPRGLGGRDRRRRPRRAGSPARRLDWSRLDFGARWLAEHERVRARTMLAKLVAWLRDTRPDLTMIAVEQEFDVVVGDARLRGRVDRLER